MRGAGVEWGGPASWSVIAECVLVLKGYKSEALYVVLVDTSEEHLKRH